MGRKPEDLDPGSCPVRNTDRTDTDFESYCDSVYDPPEKKKSGCMGAVILVLAALVLALGWLVLKLGGMIE